MTINILTFLLVFTVNYAICHDNSTTTENVITTTKTESFKTSLPIQDPFRVFGCENNVTYKDHDFWCTDYAVDCNSTCTNLELCCSPHQCCKKNPGVDVSGWYGAFVVLAVVYYCVAPAVSVLFCAGFIYLMVRAFGGPRNQVAQPQFVAYQVPPPPPNQSYFADGSAFNGPPPQYTQNPSFPVKAVY